MAAGPTLLNSTKKNSAAIPDKHEILIEGLIYDVSGFVKRHPGGSVIKFMSGQDGTEAFRQFHQRSEKAKKMLKTLPNRKPGKAGEEFAFPEKDKALLKDFRKLEQELTEEGYFEASWCHVTYRIAELFLLHLIGIYATVLGAARDGLLAWLLLGLGILVTGIAQGRCGWLMHEGGHYSLTGVMRLDRFLQELIYGFGCGMSGSWWRNQHNKHHATPQKHGHDVDLNTLPLVAFHKDCVTDSKFGRMLMGESKKKKNEVDIDVGSESKNDKQTRSKLSLWAILWLKNQACLFAPVICLLVALGWQFFLHPKHSLRTKNYQELAYFGLRCAFWYQLLTVYIGWSLPVALVWFTLYVQCGATYIFTNFAVSHTHLPTVSKDDKSTTWVHFASDHTMNVSVESKLVSWWMSYLNFQIEHHLFPQMPQYKFPTISHRVRALFEKHGRRYMTDGYFHAMKITFDNLDHVAAEAIAEFSG